VLRAVGVVALLLVVATHLRSPDAWDRGCGEVGTGIAYPAGTGPPYGTVRSCQVLDSRSDLFGGLDGGVFLLLDTDRGLVAVRVDYRDTALGRQYRADAVELAAALTPNLFPAEARRLRQSIEGRGGVRTQVWTLHYGDG
jgi:hypothetical protein